MSLIALGVVCAHTHTLDRERGYVLGHSFKQLDSHPVLPDPLTHTPSFEKGNIVARGHQQMTPTLFNISRLPLSHGICFAILFSWILNDARCEWYSFHISAHIALHVHMNLCPKSCTSWASGGRAASDVRTHFPIPTALLRDTRAYNLHFSFVPLYLYERATRLSLSLSQYTLYMTHCIIQSTCVPSSIWRNFIYVCLSSILTFAWAFVLCFFSSIFTHTQSAVECTIDEYLWCWIVVHVRCVSRSFYFIVILFLLRQKRRTNKNQQSMCLSTKNFMIFYLIFAFQWISLIQFMRWRKGDCSSSAKWTWTCWRSSFWMLNSTSYVTYQFNHLS